MNPSPNVEVPIGRVELLGQILHLVEHQGHLASVLTDETGQVVVAMEDERLSAAGCRRLLRSGIDLLLDRAEGIYKTQAERSTVALARVARPCRRSINRGPARET